MDGLRDAIATRIRSLVGSDEGGLRRPPGDPGLFGPGSASWAVHGDFTSMMIGGVAALLLQMLHPAALAGVWDHSGFRRDMTGRLRRTAQFVGGTTFGSTAAAEALVARVRRIHGRVRGVLPDGTPYAADDPALLTWVHAAEVSMFLAAHLRYRAPSLSPERQDAYLREQARLARMLGAVDVPEDRAALDAYMTGMRPHLVADDRTRTVSRLLVGQSSPSLLTAPANTLMMAAGVDLLPAWARAMHGLEQPYPAPAVRAGARGVGRVLRWALT